MDNQEILNILNQNNNSTQNMKFIISLLKEHWDDEKQCDVILNAFKSWLNKKTPPKRGFVKIN